MPKMVIVATVSAVVSLSASFTRSAPHMGHFCSPRSNSFLHFSQYISKLTPFKLKFILLFYKKLYFALKVHHKYTAKLNKGGENTNHIEKMI